MLARENLQNGDKQAFQLSAEMPSSVMGSVVPVSAQFLEFHIVWICEA